MTYAKCIIQIVIRFCIKHYVCVTSITFKLGFHIRNKGFFWLASRDKHSLLWQQSAGGISLELIGSWRSGIIEDMDHGLSETEIAQLEEILSKGSGQFGYRHCDLPVIGDKSQVNQFTNRLNSCFFSDDEITLRAEGHEFDDP